MLHFTDNLMTACIDTRYIQYKFNPYIKKVQIIKPVQKSDTITLKEKLRGYKQ